MHNANVSTKRNRGGGRTFTAERQHAETQYVFDLIAVLRTRAGGLRRWAVMQAIRRNRAKARTEIPHRFEDDVESAFQQYCGESEVHKRGSVPQKPVLFHWPLGRDGGVWALNAEGADAWLSDQSQQASNDVFDGRAMAPQPERDQLV